MKNSGITFVDTLLCVQRLAEFFELFPWFQKEHNKVYFAICLSSTFIGIPSILYAKYCIYTYWLELNKDPRFVFNTIGVRWQYGIFSDKWGILNYSYRIMNNRESSKKIIKLMNMMWNFSFNIIFYDSYSYIIFIQSCFNI